jgi:hypothetical protein
MKARPVFCETKWWYADEESEACQFAINKLACLEHSQVESSSQRDYLTYAFGTGVSVDCPNCWINVPAVER